MLPAVLISPLASADIPFSAPEGVLWAEVIRFPPEVSPDTALMLFFFLDNCGIQYQMGCAQHRQSGIPDS